MDTRITAAEYQTLVQAKAKRPSKYGNKRTEYGGRSYHSKAEASTASILDILKSAGKIRGWLPQQPSFPMPGGGKYTADFLIFITNDVFHVHDTKGFDTPESKLKRAYVKEKFGVFITTIDTELLDVVDTINDQTNVARGKK